jgi:dipeptidyl aminopeptidase/acylaminoacyl peptidase
LGAAFEPVVRSTGLLIGSLWQTQRTSLAGIARAKDDLSLEYITPAGVPCVYIRQEESRAKEIIVSLHGGPDSHELDDLRYGGIYWNTLDAGFDVLIINYPGSTGFGTEYQEQAWKNWDAAVLQTVDAITEVGAAKGVSGISIFGVSFGAWIGLQVSRHVKTRQIVAMSPILNLTQHIQLHKDADHKFRSWAEERFTQPGEKRLNGERYALACPVPVVVLAPDKDEVVLPASTQNSILATTRAGRHWTTITVPGNHYPRTSAEADKRWTALTNALNTNQR